MTTDLTTRPDLSTGSGHRLEAVKHLALDTLTSRHSVRAYDQALTDFLAWYADQGRPQLRKAVVESYKQKLIAEDLAPATINQRLSAVRKLVSEAADNGLMDPVLAASVANVKGVTTGGQRLGNWLTREQAQALLNAPDTRTLKGKRDQAILATLLGAGLRRTEAARLRFEDIQQRNGRWVLVDIVGKRNKTRSIPFPSWAKVAIDRWTKTAGRHQGRVFVRLTRGGRIGGGSLTPQAIYNVVSEYAKACGFDGLAAHDLRRTFAHLALDGGASIEQIQLSLGHASIETTERYLGIEQDLHDAPCDRLGLKL